MIKLCWGFENLRTTEKSPILQEKKQNKTKQKQKQKTKNIHNFKNTKS